MTPYLAIDDPNPAVRKKQIEKAREDYRYDFSHAGIVFAAEVPKGNNDGFSIKYLAEAAAINLRVAANEAAGRALQLGDGLKRDLDEWLGKNDTSTTVDGRPNTLEVYSDAIATLPEPLGLKVWDEDWAFGWQRVAGESAHMLNRAEGLPDHFPVTEDHFRQALGTRAEGDSLAAALAEGRVYLADFAMLDGVPNNTSGGVQHFMYAPLGLFCVEKSHARRLMPVAIQCAQTPGPQVPLFTPADGRLWTLAKQCFQVADMTIHGQVFHMGHCHTLLEALILSSHRTLAPNHPLMVLLMPHFEFTLGANEVAKGSLVTPGGYVDQLLGASLDTENKLVKDGADSVHWRDLVATREFEVAGTADTSALPIFPWRDDSLLSWPVVLEMVRAYIDLYYASDEAVALDTELRAWLIEIGSDDGARLKSFVDPTEIVTRDTLALLIAGIIFRATVYHAGVNYTGYDWQLYAPNKSGSGYAPAPTRSTVDHVDSLRAMLPPTDLVYLISKLLMQQRELKLTRMLRYEEEAFADPRVTPILTRAQAGLDEVDRTIAARNIRRPLVYEHASPANIPNSIMV